MTDAGGPAVVHLPRSLASLFPEAERRMDARGGTVLEVVRDLDTRVPGLANRVLDAGPRSGAISTCSSTASSRRSTRPCRRARRCT